MATTKKTEPKTYYFARAAHQAAVLWNKDKKTPWAEFDKWGMFATTDKVVAQAVLDAGYYQITIEDIETRGLPVPTGDSPTQNFQPGAPGRGYRLEGGVPATAMPHPDMDLEPQGFVQPNGGVPGEEDFPPGPPPESGEKRKLR